MIWWSRNEVSQRSRWFDVFSNDLLLPKFHSEPRHVSLDTLPVFLLKFQLIPWSPMSLCQKDLLNPSQHIWTRPGTANLHWLGTSGCCGLRHSQIKNLGKELRCALWTHHCRFKVICLYTLLYTFITFYILLIYSMSLSVFLLKLQFLSRLFCRVISPPDWGTGGARSPTPRDPSLEEWTSNRFEKKPTTQHPPTKRMMILILLNCGRLGILKVWHGFMVYGSFSNRADWAVVIRIFHREYKDSLYLQYVYNIYLNFIHNCVKLDKTTTSSEGTWPWEESEWSTHESQLHSPWSEQKPAPAGKLYSLQRHSDWMIWYHWYQKKLSVAIHHWVQQFLQTPHANRKLDYLRM